VLILTLSRNRAAEFFNIGGAMATMYIVYEAVNQSLSTVGPLPQRGGTQLAFGLVVVGLAVIRTCFLNLQTLRKVPEAAARRVELASSPKRPIVTREKTTVNVSAEYLSGLYYGYKQSHAERLLKPYLGKWITVSGVIEDFGERALSQVRLSFKTPNPSMWFDEEWQDRLSTFKPGDRITVIGQISSVMVTYVQLNHCEIVENHETP
jgi:hypothetical protein